MAELYNILKANGAQFGDQASGDFTEVEPNGFLEANGGAIAYRDEYPSHPWVAAGAQAAPDLANHTIGGVPRRVYTFDGNNTEERLSSSFEIPHDYAYCEPIEVHVHIRPTTNTAGDIKFFFDWEHSPAQGAPAAQTSLSMAMSVSINQQYFQLINALGDLPDLGFQLGDKIGFNIRRTPTDVEDTYPDDAILEQVALHVPVNTNGSRQRYVK